MWSLVTFGSWGYSLLDICHARYLVANIYYYYYYIYLLIYIIIFYLVFIYLIFIFLLYITPFVNTFYFTSLLFFATRSLLFIICYSLLIICHSLLNPNLHTFLPILQLF